MASFVSNHKLEHRKGLDIDLNIMLRSILLDFISVSMDNRCFLHIGFQGEG